MDEKKDEQSPESKQFYYPALYLGGVPAEIPKKKKKWWKRIETISWSDFFQIEQNKMNVYRIIPHSNVSNNTRRLWKSIYKMYEMYESPGTRLERDGLRFVFREKDLFWFDVIFKQVDGQKKIEFYVSTSEYQAIKLKRKLENKMSVTIKEASIEQIQVPEENTIVQDLKYLKHDIFSLNTNINEQKTPIAAVMNTLDELQYDGDFARLSICNEAENRHKWIKNASWAYEKLSKGKVPQRATLNSKMILGASKKTLGGFVNEINFLITDLFNALSNTFFKSDKSYNKEKLIVKPFSLEDEINARHVSGASREKLNNAVFKSHIRIVAHSQDRLTRETISETLSLSFSEIADNNELHGDKINVKSRKKEVIQELNTLHLSKRTKMNGNVNLISTDEMAKLAMQIPTAELQRRYEDALNVKKRTETDIPSVLCDPKNLLIGYAEHKDKKLNIGLQADQKEEFYCGYTFIGKQGSGKDNSIQNFVYEGAIKHNISFVIPDWICQPGHKGMADGIRDLLPPEKIIDLDLSDENYIIPMDLTEVIEKLGRKGGSRFALEMIDFMNLEGLARSEKYLMEAAKASNGSLYNIKKIIEDEDYRVDRISELLEEGYERLAKELLQWGDNEELSNKCDAILSRLNMFFGDDTLHDIFAQQPKENVNFEKWMKEGKVIIIRMPKRKIGTASNILAHWVTLKVLMTRMLMSEEDKDRHGCFLIFNEPEQVESKGLAKLMGRIATEGRKERLGSIFAFHHWGKLPDYLQDNLIAGGVNQFLFANDHKRTFELAKERLHPTFTVEDALRTPKHYSIAILNTKEPLHAFMVHMLPPREERFDNSKLTEIHAKMFGRSWSDIQKFW
ncbi:ATP-binding protein [Bacillus pseudomycoides]|uniref:ATP-binding protein n=1 Tax=Bacillus pseudomycoides TaxID=64104 RepID=UPI000BF24461|nr:ATP-binding protein [Bacillus pseudomycoides]PEK70430.1 ATP-binding protein [Bacillus pseudomycoides]